MRAKLESGPLRSIISSASRRFRVQHRRRALPFIAVWGVVLAVLLSACTLTPSNVTPAIPTTASLVVTATSSATDTPTATTTATPVTTAFSASPTATAVPATPTPSPTLAATPNTADASPTAAATPSSDVVAAIKQVIQTANQEQEQAYSTSDPTLMQDTATANYYSQLVQGLQSLANAGITAIHLANLKWGPVSLQGPTTAQATTSETWTSTFADGSQQQETDTNVYSLVLQGGNWKIASDQFPDTRTLQSPTATPGSSATPGVIATPAPGSSTSTNWAGYAATGGTFTGVTADWTVPNVSITAEPAADATWVGIGGVSSTDLIQAGTDAIVESGQVTYAAWIETLPQSAQNVPLAVTAGDHVHVSIEQQADGSWQIQIKDLTSNQSYKTTVHYQSSRSSAEWIQESPASGRSVLLPLDNFGSVSFSNASATENGQQRTIAQADGKPITMEVRAGQALAVPSSLGSDGASFTVARTAVPAPQVSPRGHRFRGSGG